MFAGEMPPKNEMVVAAVTQRRLASEAAVGEKQRPLSPSPPPAAVVCHPPGEAPEFGLQGVDEAPPPAQPPPAHTTIMMVVMTIVMAIAITGIMITITMPIAIQITIIVILNSSCTIRLL